tara:strand:- start:517 stop:1170 length:654 start_codon:yes stop_codon:yes gene_type:complete
MKVNIKKAGRKRTYNLVNSWAEVTLEKWIKLIALEEGSNTKEAQETIALLSDIPDKLINELSLRDIVLIMEKIANLDSEKESILKKVIEIDGVEYGMHPDLSEITLGEYADIETLIKLGLNKNLPDLMAILFRKVTERNGKAYTIEAYDGNISIRAETMKKMTAEQVKSTLFFFYNFVTALSKIMPSFLIQRKQEIAEQLRMATLRNDGAGSESYTG